MRMRTENERKFDVTGGPSKDLIFDAFKYAYSKTSKINLDFHVVLGYSLPKDHYASCAFLVPTSDFRITEVSYEDGSGDRLILHGYCKADLHAMGKESMKLHEFRAYYDTKRREGVMTFIIE